MQLLFNIWKNAIIKHFTLICANPFCVEGIKTFPWLVWDGYLPIVLVTQKERSLDENLNDRLTTPTTLPWLVLDDYLPIVLVTPDKPWWTIKFKWHAYYMYA